MTQDTKISETMETPIPLDMKFQIIQHPEKAVLTISPGFMIHFTHDKPNWWWRMWQFLLLGWRWCSLKPINPEDKKKGDKN